MTTLETLKEKKSTIDKLKQELDVKFSELESKRDAFLQDLQKEIDPLKTRLDSEMANYKAELKAYCGVCDGETITIFDVIELVKRVPELK